MNGKPWYQSKTIWVNLVILLVGILGVVADSELVPPKVVVYITGIALPIANMVLRMITTKAIHQPGKK